MRRLVPYLQLVRLPNLFTAAADPIAGWLLVGGALGDPRGWGPLAASGVATYAAGMVLNDVFDFETDRVERPGRPLPSGRVSRRVAAVLGAALLALGPLLASAAGPRSLAVAIALAACVLAYDAGLKRTPIGPVVMGACRSLNLGLGLSVDPRLGGPAGWLAASAFGLFVAGVTRISRDEAAAEGVRPRGVRTGMLAEVFALVVLMTAVGIVPFPGREPFRSSRPPTGEGVLLAVMYVVSLAGLRAIRGPTPASLQAAVKTGVLALIWIDVGLVASVRGVGPALAVAALWVPAFLLGKWLYST